MTNWISVCNVADIPVLGSRRVARAKGPQVALFRTADDRVHALLDPAGQDLLQRSLHRHRQRREQLRRVRGDLCAR